MRDDDSDIDALVSSVVGNNGTPAVFPPPPAEIVPIRSAAKRKARRELAEQLVTSDQLAIDQLSGALAEMLDGNITERVYIDPRTIAARFSNLKSFSLSAAHYEHRVQQQDDDSLARRIGRGGHALLLDQPAIRFMGRRAGKAWLRFKAQHADKEILSPKEWEIANGMATAVRRHPIASRILLDGTTLEETLEWEFMGKKCTSRPDARLGTKRLVDLKTTRCAEPRKFALDAMRMGYHAQFSFYSKAIETLFGSKPEECYCVAVENKAPYAVTVLQLTETALIEGEKCWRSWFEQLLVCEAANRWPAYCEAVEKFDVMSTDDTSLIIDGEEFNFDDE